jgi:hypothetical protein
MHQDISLTGLSLSILSASGHGEFKRRANA